jgi:hypothetical protein
MLVANVFRAEDKMKEAGSSETMVTDYETRVSQPRGI